MPKPLSWPIGIFLITISLAYRQWSVLVALYSVGDAHRLALFLGGGLLVVMIVLRLMLGNWQRAFIGSLIVPLILHPLLQSFLIPSIIIGIGVVMLIVEKRLIPDRFLAAVNAVALMSVTSFTPMLKVMLQPDTMVPNSTAPLDKLTLQQKPSIVHVLLDGYGSSPVLKEMYNLPVDDFNARLRDRGFVVFEKSVVPYNQTLLSMASLFSAGYLQPRDGSATNADYRGQLGNTVHNGFVKQTLRNAGYNFFFTKSGVSTLDLGGGTAVASHKIRATGLEVTFLTNARLPAPSNSGPTDYLRDALKPGLLNDLPQPFYFYEHLIAPHPPFDIDRDGEPRFTPLVSLSDASHAVQENNGLRTEYLRGYREKTLYLWSGLIAQIDAMPDIPRLMIIHGDHGPGSHVDHAEVSKSCLRERMTTTVAIYTDDPAFRATLEQMSTETFGTSNLFRLVFSHLSGQPVPLLPVRSHYASWRDLSNVTPLSLDEIDKPCEMKVKLEAE